MLGMLGVGGLFFTAWTCPEFCVRAGLGEWVGGGNQTPETSSEFVGMYLQHLSSGLCPLVFQAMNIPFRVLSAAEAKPSGRRFIMDRWGSKVEHLFKDNEDIVRGEGFCYVHNAQCKLDMGVRPDVAVAGLPCVAFSRLRTKNQGELSEHLGPAEKHPAYQVVMTQWPEYLEARRPAAWLVEEVDVFATTRPQDNSCKTAAVMFMEAAAKSGDGYAVEAQVLDHVQWVQLSRRRCWFVGMSAGLGSNQGCKAVFAGYSEAAKLRALGPKTSVLEFVDDSTIEMSRRLLEPEQPGQVCSLNPTCTFAKTDLDIFWTFFGHFLDKIVRKMSEKCPRNVRKLSEKCAHDRVGFF